jgi:hypothetical protein
MPEFTAPGIGRESTKIEIDLEVPANASGVCSTGRRRQR